MIIRFLLYGDAVVSKNRDLNKSHASLFTMKTFLPSMMLFKYS